MQIHCALVLQAAPGRVQTMSEILQTPASSSTAALPRALIGRFCGIRSKGVLATLCGVTIITICIATLWPFDFFEANGARWIPESGGITFSRPGVVVSRSALQAGGGQPNAPWTLELVVRPASTESIHTILSVYRPGNPRQLMVRQRNAQLLIQRDSMGAGIRAETTRLLVNDVFQSGELISLTITSGSDGTIVYTNGIQRQAFANLAIPRSDFDGQLILGVSPVRYDPWLGELRGLSIYATQLSPDEISRHYQRSASESGEPDLATAVVRYSFAGPSGSLIHREADTGPILEIPRNFRVPHKPFLRSPANQFEMNWYYLHDILANIVGFIPLGLALSAYWGCSRNARWAALCSVIAGFALSLTVELLQAYIPQRDSGITDVITNTLGTTVGAFLARPLILVILKAAKISEPAYGSHRST